MAKMCTVSGLERQFATLYLFHAPTEGGGGRGAGRVFAGHLGGGGAKYSFSAPKFPPRNAWEAKSYFSAIFPLFSSEG